MSLSNQTVKNIYTANGIVQNFAVTSQIISNDQLEVYTLDVTDPYNVVVAQKVEVTHFTFNSDPATLVQFLVAPTAGLLVVIARKTPLTQEMDLLPTQAFSNEDAEVNLDRLAMMVQELYHRAVLLPVHYGDTSFDPLTYPSANALVGVNATNDGFEFKTVPGLGGAYITSTLGAALNNGDAITSGTENRSLINIVGSGHVTLSATPVTNGTWDGQEVLLVGQDDANTVTILSTSTNMDMNGDISLGKNDMLELVWIAGDSKWVEKSRRT